MKSSRDATSRVEQRSVSRADAFEAALKLRWKRAKGFARAARDGRVP